MKQTMLTLIDMNMCFPKLDNDVYYVSVPTLFKKHYIKKYKRQGYYVKETQSYITSIQHEWDDRYLREWNKSKGETKWEKTKKHKNMV